MATLQEIEAVLNEITKVLRGSFGASGAGGVGASAGATLHAAADAAKARVGIDFTGLIQQLSLDVQAVTTTHATTPVLDALLAQAQRVRDGLNTIEQTIRDTQNPKPKPKPKSQVGPLVAVAIFIVLVLVASYSGHR